MLPNDRDICAGCFVHLGYRFRMFNSGTFTELRLIVVDENMSQLSTDAAPLQALPLYGPYYFIYITFL